MWIYSGGGVVPNLRCVALGTKARAGVSCRFHDLRHTGCTRLLEAGIPFPVAATIMGWSPSTTVRMSRRYGHIGQGAQRLAVNALKEAGIQDDGHKFGHNPKHAHRSNWLTD